MAALEPAIVPLRVGRKASTPWILRPRTFYVSPLAGLAVAAGLVAVITMSVLRTQPSVDLASTDSPDVVLPDDSRILPVAAVPSAQAEAFTYIDRGAKSVAVVGSFN